MKALIKAQVEHFIQFLSPEDAQTIAEAWVNLDSKTQCHFVSKWMDVPEPIDAWINEILPEVSDYSLSALKDFFYNAWEHVLEYTD